MKRLRGEIVTLYDFSLLIKGVHWYWIWLILVIVIELKVIHKRRRIVIV